MSDIAPPKSFWTSRFGIVVETIILAASIYLITFISLVLSKPACVLKRSLQTTKLSLGCFKPSEGVEGIEAKAKSEEQPEEKDGIAPVMAQLSQLIVTQSPIAQFAVAQLKRQVSEERIQTFVSWLTKTKAEKYWEEAEIDWTILCSVAAVPSVLFVLLVAAAI